MSSTNKKMRAERAAALLAERERAEKRRQRLTVAGVVLALVLIVAVGFGINHFRDSTNDVSSGSGSAAKYGLTIGAKDAPHQVVIYEDFLCPVCGAFEAASHDKLASLADDGKVSVTYRPFILLEQAGDYSERTAAAFGVLLDKSGPDVAKKFHDLLYANQPSESGPFPDDDAIVDLAVQAGADEDQVGDAIRDLDGKDFAEGATDAATEAGVHSTPTILLDDKVYSDGSSMEEIADNLAAAVS